MKLNNQSNYKTAIACSLLLLSNVVVSATTTTTTSDEGRRDLTIACGLDLNDCRLALQQAEDRCAPQPVPVPVAAPVPMGPTAPVATGTIEDVGDNGVPEDVFPLGLCAGDCDDDSECMDGLICYQRDEGTDRNQIPGCTGIGNPDGSDYCCDPSFEGCVSSDGGGGFNFQDILDILFGFLDIFGLGRGGANRRTLTVANSNNNNKERKLLFGLINRECQALLRRCEENLASFSCQPTIAPTDAPTLSPTKSRMPSEMPNARPSASPTITPKPTKAPTKRPTRRPTKQPTRRPTLAPVPVNQMGMQKLVRY